MGFRRALQVCQEICLANLPSTRIVEATINRRLPMAEENKPEQQTPASTNAQNKLQSSKEHARKAAEDLKSAAGAIAGEYRGKAEQAWGEARGKAEQAWGDARDRARTFQDDAEQYVRENPTKAIFTALGIGFVLGLIFRR
ncbi:MAG: hypothetical protein DMF20_02425 [Verrucomicrobia bacterium]|nr:MAG: hypothetical protein DMF20_02425 [Verrucomicrobiota bacterium]